MEVTAEKKMATDCIALIQRKIAREMTTDEYYLALMELHKKYPLKCDHNFYDVAQMYAKKIPTVSMKSSKGSHVNEKLPYKDE